MTSFLKIVLARVHDLQLAIVIIRLYETEAQFEFITELLCNEILGCDVEQFRLVTNIYENGKTIEPVTFPNAKGFFFFSFFFNLF